jgi:hypothetical protein
MLLLLIIWPILIFVLLTFVMLPLQFTVKSVFGIFTIPGEILEIATNRRLRQNHALEHATINVIEEYYGRRLPIAGLANENGFYVRGPVDPAMVEEAARIGLTRLKMGERYLAIHDNCGTSITMVNFISSVVFLLMLFSTGLFNFFNIFLAMLFANLLGPTLGRIAQRYLTTDTDVSEIGIDGIQTYSQHHGLNFIFANTSIGEYFVRTREAVFITP